MLYWIYFFINIDHVRHDTYGTILTAVSLLVSLIIHKVIVILNIWIWGVGVKQCDILSTFLSAKSCLTRHTKYKKFLFSNRQQVITQLCINLHKYSNMTEWNHSHHQFSYSKYSLIKFRKILKQYHFVGIVFQMYTYICLFIEYLAIEVIL